jgi:drug/metabolite transporter (DMT)-like permease
LSLVIGDSLLFAAFAAIGTRQTMLISSLIPVFGALLAWLLLGETLTGFQAVGIGVIVLGVAWVALERTPGADVTAPRGMNRRGLLLAVGSAVFSALGAIASKRGLVGDFSALSAQMLRVLVALVVIALPLTRSGAWGRLVTEVRAHPEARQFLFWGALFGPLLGMWFSLLALQRTNVGIATALTSLPPIWLLLIGRFAFREQIGRRAVLGSLVAVAGVALMFVSGG